MPTGLDIIKRALRSINVLESGESPDNAETNDALDTANEMFDSWNAEGYMIFSIGINDFPLSSSQQIYTLGTGGDFNIPRPENLNYASIVILNNPAEPVEYPIPIYTTQDWQQHIPIKNVPGNLPLLVYDDGNFPLRSLTFWPSGATNCSFRLYSWQKLNNFPDLVTSRTYPAGYLEAIRYNLAIRLATEYGAPVSPELAALAMSSLARVKSSNPDDTQLRSDLVGQYPSSGNVRAELFNGMS